MRVIRCPHCDEPLPGFANFCAICGESLSPTPTSMTTKLSRRPRAIKVPRFFALKNDAEETARFGAVSLASSAEETVKLVQRPPGSIPADSSEDLTAGPMETGIKWWIRVLVLPRCHGLLYLYHPNLHEGGSSMGQYRSFS